MENRHVTAGSGRLRSGHRDLGAANYEIHVEPEPAAGMVVELEAPPNAQNGEVLDLTLEDGRVLQCQARDMSPYCAVLGDGPLLDRRRSVDVRPPEPAPSTDRHRRRSDHSYTVTFPCPRCTATACLVTHRGLNLTTLFCTKCEHGWGEHPAAVSGAERVDRRGSTRPEAMERRGTNRLVAPTCVYCGTDAHVRSTRRTPKEVYFVCTGCEVMWALPRPSSPSASTTA